MRSNCDEDLWESEILDKLPKKRYMISDIYDDRFAIDDRFDCSLELHILHERNIEHLIHFTHIANLEGILNNGIHAPENLPEDSIIVTSGLERAACEQNCSCFSITRPDYVLFTKVWGRSRKEDYAVLGINVDILGLYGEADVAFVPDNARVKEYRDSFEQCTGISYLLDMFRNHFEFRGKPCLRYPGLPNEYPNNPQAEILLRGTVPERYIDVIYVYSQEIKEELEQVLRHMKCTIPIEVDREMFNPRADYEMWQRNRLEAEEDKQTQIDYWGKQRSSYPYIR